MHALTHAHAHTHAHTHTHTHTSWVNFNAVEQMLKRKKKAVELSDHPAHFAENKKSSMIAKSLHFKRADYPPDVVKFVMGLRASSYNVGGTCLAHLFETLDIDHSGDLDCNEFKLALRRFVCHACHCVCRVELDR